MSVAVEKLKITRTEAQEIADECYVIEEIDEYMQKKYHKDPEVIRMFEPRGKHFILPFHIARKFGFETEGMPWYLIQPLKETEDNIYDHDEDDPDFRPFHGEFRDYQEDIIEELLQQLNEHCSTTLGLPPGWGKTMAGIFLAWRLGLRTLVLMSLTKVLEGWVETCRKFLPGFKIWIVGSGTPCPPDVDVILCMDKRFNQIPEEILPTIGTFIADEFHLLCTEKRMDIYLNLFPKYVILETATLEQSKLYKMAHKLAGEHGVFKVSTEPYNVYLIKTNIMGEETRDKEGTLRTEKLRQSLVNNEFRQSIMLNILMQNCEYYKSICLRMVKDSIPEFVDKVNECGITCDSLYGTKGKCENSQVTVGTSQKMGTGYDEENSCMNFWKNPIKSNFMIFENTTPNKYIFEQNRGRVMRSKNPVIAFLLDRNSNCRSQINRLKPWIKETNGTIIEVNYWDFVLPQINKIYTRPYTTGTFYRIVTHKEYDLFKSYHILEANRYDYSESALVIHGTDDEVCEEIEKRKITSCYVFEIEYVNVLQCEEDKEYISTCPICEFQVQNIHSYIGG